MHRVTVGLALLTLASVACGPHYRPFTQADLLHGGSVGGYDLSGPPPSDEALARRVSGGRETGFLELDRVGDDWVRAAGSGGELEVFYDHEGRPVAVLGVPRDADGYAVDLEGQPGTPSPVRLVGRGAGWGDLYATDQREVYLGIVDGSARYLMRVMDEEVFTNRWLGPVLRIDDLNTRARLAIASGDADEQVAILSTLDTFRSPDVEALAAEVRLALGSEVAQALDLAEGDTRTVHDRARGLAEVASALARAGGSAEDAQRLGALWDGLDGALAAEGEVAARTLLDERGSLRSALGPGVSPDVLDRITSIGRLIEATTGFRERWAAADLGGRMELYRGLRMADGDPDTRAYVRTLVLDVHEELLGQLLERAAIAEAEGALATAAGLDLVAADLLGEPVDVAPVTLDRTLAAIDTATLASPRMRARVRLTRLALQAFPRIGSGGTPEELRALRRAYGRHDLPAPFWELTALRIDPDALSTEVPPIGLRRGPVEVVSPVNPELIYGSRMVEGLVERRVLSGDVGHAVWRRDVDDLQLQLGQLDQALVRASAAAGVRTSGGGGPATTMTYEEEDGDVVTEYRPGTPSYTWQTQRARAASVEATTLQRERDRVVSHLNDLAAAEPEVSVTMVQEPGMVETGLVTQVWWGTVQRPTTLTGPGGSTNVPQLADLHTLPELRYERIGPTLGPPRSDHHVDADRAVADAGRVLDQRLEDDLAIPLTVQLAAAAQRWAEAQGADQVEGDWVGFFFLPASLRERSPWPATPGLDVPPPPSRILPASIRPPPPPPPRPSSATLTFKPVPPDPDRDDPGRAWDGPARRVRVQGERLVAVDPRTDTVLETLHAAPTRFLVSPDGRRVVWWTEDGVTARGPTGDAAPIRGGDLDRVLDLAFAAGSDHLVVSTRFDGVAVVDLVAGRVRHRIDPRVGIGLGNDEDGPELASISISPDGRRVALLDAQGVLQVWELLDDGTAKCVRVERLVRFESNIYDRRAYPAVPLASSVSFDATGNWVLFTGHHSTRVQESEGVRTDIPAEVFETWIPMDGGRPHGFRWDS